MAPGAVELVEKEAFDRFRRLISVEAAVFNSELLCHRVGYFLFLVSTPLKGEINANTTGGTRKRKGRLDTATTPPAEASGVSGAMPTVRTEEGLVLVRGRVRVVRSGRGVAG